MRNQSSMAILALIFSSTLLHTTNSATLAPSLPPTSPSSPKSSPKAPTSSPKTPIISSPPVSPPSLPPTTAFAPAPTPPAGAECTDALLNLSSCLTYVEAGSKQKVPDAGCCSSFGYLVDNTPQCLCYLLAGAAASYGIQIDNAKALKLPSVCNVVTPPVSLCSEIGIPVPNIFGPSPAQSPSSGGPTGSSAPSSSSPNGQNSSPSLRGSRLLQLAALAFALAITAIF